MSTRISKFYELFLLLLPMADAHFVRLLYPTYFPQLIRLSFHGSASSITQFLPILCAVLNFPFFACIRAVTGLFLCSFAYSTKLISILSLQYAVCATDFSYALEQHTKAFVIEFGANKTFLGHIRIYPNKPPSHAQITNACVILVFA